MSCDQCQMVAINGVATHETGCPNTPRECDECGSAFAGPRYQRTCPDCLEGNDATIT